MTRVVSLVPSITETLLSWGVEPVAVTRFCEAPGLRVVGGTKNPDLAAIIALAPDAVLMDEEENRRPDAESLGEAGLRVVATAVRSLADVGPALARLAAVVGRQPPPPARWPPAPAVASVWVPIWRRPWMTVGPTYATDLLAAAGFRNVYGDGPEPYPMIADLDEVRVKGPDLVLAPSEPYRFTERHRRELSTVAPVRFVDGRDLFWWGSRTPSALERLRELASV